MDSIVLCGIDFAPDGEQLLSGIVRQAQIRRDALAPYPVRSQNGGNVVVPALAFSLRHRRNV
jgi:hypothetical protein